MLVCRWQLSYNDQTSCLHLPQSLIDIGMTMQYDMPRQCYYWNYFSWGFDPSSVLGNEPRIYYFWQDFLSCCCCYSGGVTNIEPSLQQSSTLTQITTIFAIEMIITHLFYPRFLSSKPPHLTSPPLSIIVSHRPHSIKSLDCMSSVSRDGKVECYYRYHRY